MSAEILASVKMHLRISHNKLDNEINEMIEAAEEDMQRAGICEEVVITHGPLVLRALKVFVAAELSDDETKSDKLRGSYQQMVDEIRRSRTNRSIADE